jgi:hypothetical protein
MVDLRLGKEIKGGSCLVVLGDAGFAGLWVAAVCDSAGVRRAGRWFRRKELREAAAEEESRGCLVGLAAGAGSAERGNGGCLGSSFASKGRGKMAGSRGWNLGGCFFLCSLVLFEPRERPSSGWFREKENGGTAWRPVSKRGGSGEEGKEMVVPAGSEK